MAKSSILGTLALLFGATSLLAGQGGTLPFTRDYKAGEAEAHRNGRPAVVFFTADW